MDTRSNTAKDCRGILHLFRLGKNKVNTDCSGCRVLPEQAVCLGEDQAFMMEIMIADELQWKIGKGKLLCSDTEFQKASMDLRCKKRSQDSQSLSAAFLWNEDLREEEIISFLFDCRDRFRPWEDVCESVTVTLAVNSCYPVADRNSLIHLCMNGKGGAILFRRIIMKTMSSLAANWYQKEELEKTADFLSDFLQRLINYEYSSELEENMKSRRNCLISRIYGSNIDMLYPVIKPEREADGIRELKNGDILTYFAHLESGERKFYASRLSLIKQIFFITGLSEKFEISEVLYQIDERPIEPLYQIHETPIETSYTRKICEILNGMKNQTEERETEAARRLSIMFDRCMDEWIDEDINDMLEWINS